MALKFVCDRCGRELGYGTNVRIEWRRPNEQTFYRSIDLCQSCATERMERVIAALDLPK